MCIHVYIYIYMYVYTYIYIYINIIHNIRPIESHEITVLPAFFMMPSSGRMAFTFAQQMPWRLSTLPNWSLRVLAQSPGVLAHLPLVPPVVGMVGVDDILSRR